MSKRKLLIPCLVPPNTSTTQPATSHNVQGGTSAVPHSGATSAAPRQAPRAALIARGIHSAPAHTSPAVALCADNTDSSCASSAPTAVVVAGAPDHGPATGVSAIRDTTVEEPPQQPAFGGFMLRGGKHAVTTARDGMRKTQKSLLPLANTGSAVPPSQNNDASRKPELDTNTTVSNGNDGPSSREAANENNQQMNAPPDSTVLNKSKLSSKGKNTLVFNYHTNVNAGENLNGHEIGSTRIPDAQVLLSERAASPPGAQQQALLSSSGKGPSDNNSGFSAPICGDGTSRSCASEDNSGHLRTTRVADQPQSAASSDAMHHEASSCAYKQTVSDSTVVLQSGPAGCFPAQKEPPSGLVSHNGSSMDFAHQTHNGFINFSPQHNGLQSGLSVHNSSMLDNAPQKGLMNNLHQQSAPVNGFSLQNGQTSGIPPHNGLATGTAAQNGLVNGMMSNSELPSGHASKDGFNASQNDNQCTMSFNPNGGLPIVFRTSKRVHPLYVAQAKAKEKAKAEKAAKAKVKSKAKAKARNKRGRKAEEEFCAVDGNIEAERQSAQARLGSSKASQSILGIPSTQQQQQWQGQFLQSQQQHGDLNQHAQSQNASQQQLQFAGPNYQAQNQHALQGHHFSSTQQTHCQFPQHPSQQYSGLYQQTQGPCSTLQNVDSMLHQQASSSQKNQNGVRVRQHELCPNFDANKNRMLSHAFHQNSNLQAANQGAGQHKPSSISQQQQSASQPPGDDPYQRVQGTLPYNCGLNTASDPLTTNQQSQYSFNSISSQHPDATQRPVPCNQRLQGPLPRGFGPISLHDPSKSSAAKDLLATNQQSQNQSQDSFGSISHQQAAWTHCPVARDQGAQGVAAHNFEPNSHHETSKPSAAKHTPPTNPQSQSQLQLSFGSISNQQSGALQHPLLAGNQRSQGQPPQGFWSISHKQAKEIQDPISTNHQCQPSRAHDDSHQNAEDWLRQAQHRAEKGEFQPHSGKGGFQTLRDCVSNNVFSVQPQTGIQHAGDTNHHEKGLGCTDQEYPDTQNNVKIVPEWKGDAKECEEKQGREDANVAVRTDAREGMPSYNDCRHGTLVGKNSHTGQHGVTVDGTVAMSRRKGNDGTFHESCDDTRVKSTDFLRDEGKHVSQSTANCSNYASIFVAVADSVSHDGVQDAKMDGSASERANESYASAKKNVQGNERVSSERQSCRDNESGRLSKAISARVVANSTNGQVDGDESTRVKERVSSVGASNLPDEMEKHDPRTTQTLSVDTGCNKRARDDEYDMEVSSVMRVEKHARLAGKGSAGFGAEMSALMQQDSTLSSGGGNDALAYDSDSLLCSSGKGMHASMHQNASPRTGGSNDSAPRNRNGASTLMQQDATLSTRDDKNSSASNSSISVSVPMQQDLTPKTHNSIDLLTLSSGKEASALTQQEPTIKADDGHDLIACCSRNGASAPMQQNATLSAYDGNGSASRNSGNGASVLTQENLTLKADNSNYPFAGVIGTRASASMQQDANLKDDNSNDLLARNNNKVASARTQKDLTLKAENSKDALSCVSSTGASAPVQRDLTVKTHNSSEPLACDNGKGINARVQQKRTVDSGRSNDSLPNVSPNGPNVPEQRKSTLSASQSDEATTCDNCGGTEAFCKEELSDQDGVPGCGDEVVDPGASVAIIQSQETERGGGEWKIVTARAGTIRETPTADGELPMNAVGNPGVEAEQVLTNARKDEHSAAHGIQRVSGVCQSTAWKESGDKSTAKNILAEKIESSEMHGSKRDVVKKGWELKGDNLGKGEFIENHRDARVDSTSKGDSSGDVMENEHCGKMDSKGWCITQTDAHLDEGVVANSAGGNRGGGFKGNGATEGQWAWLRTKGSRGHKGGMGSLDTQRDSTCEGHGEGVESKGQCYSAGDMRTEVPYGWKGGDSVVNKGPYAYMGSKTEANSKDGLESKGRGKSDFMHKDHAEGAVWTGRDFNKGKCLEKGLYDSEKGYFKGDVTQNPCFRGMDSKGKSRGSKGVTIKEGNSGEEDLHGKVFFNGGYIEKGHPEWTRKGFCKGDFMVDIPYNATEMNGKSIGKSHCTPGEKWARKELNGTGFHKSEFSKTSHGEGMTLKSTRCHKGEFLSAERDEGMKFMDCRTANCMEKGQYTEVEGVGKGSFVGKGPRLQTKFKGSACDQDDRMSKGKSIAGIYDQEPLDEKCCGVTDHSEAKGSQRVVVGCEGHSGVIGNSNHKSTLDIRGQNGMHAGVANEHSEGRKEPLSPVNGQKDDTSVNVHEHCAAAPPRQGVSIEEQVPVRHKVAHQREPFADGGAGDAFDAKITHRYASDVTTVRRETADVDITGRETHQSAQGRDQLAKNVATDHPNASAGRRLPIVPRLHHPQHASIFDLHTPAGPKRMFNTPGGYSASPNNVDDIKNGTLQYVPLRASYLPPHSGWNPQSVADDACTAPVRVVSPPNNHADVRIGGHTEPRIWELSPEARERRQPDQAHAQAPPPLVAHRPALLCSAPARVVPHLYDSSAVGHTEELPVAQYAPIPLRNLGGQHTSALTRDLQAVNAHRCAREDDAMNGHKTTRGDLPNGDGRVMWAPPRTDEIAPLKFNMIEVVGRQRPLHRFEIENPRWSWNSDVMAFEFLPPIPCFEKLDIARYREILS